MQFRFGEKRKNKRVTIDEIMSTLIKINNDLEEFRTEKIGCVERLELEKSEIESQIKTTKNDQERSEKISDNLRQLMVI